MDRPHPAHKTTSQKKYAAQDEVYRVFDELNGGMPHFAREQNRNRQKSLSFSPPFRVPAPTQVVWSIFELINLTAPSAIRR